MRENTYIKFSIISLIEFFSWKRSGNICTAKRQICTHQSAISFPTPEKFYPDQNSHNVSSALRHYFLHPVHAKRETKLRSRTIFSDQKIFISFWKWIRTLLSNGAIPGKRSQVVDMEQRPASLPKRVGAGNFIQSSREKSRNYSPLPQILGNDAGLW